LVVGPLSEFWIKPFAQALSNNVIMKHIDFWPKCYLERMVFMLDTDEIKKIIPHRYPFLLVDRVLELEEGKRAVGIKNVSVNEEFFQGHFPEKPVMPGVLIVEALAQVGACAILSSDDNRGKIALFAGIDGMRFKRQVVPGDRLQLEVQLTKVKGSIGKGKAKATVDGEIVAEGELMFAVVNG
jgi:3-hydroxyacyl-[acyl-carrier-protein] dehydratase